MNDLTKKHCLPCEGGVAALSVDEIKEQLKQLGKEWQVGGDYKKISKDFKFKNYYHTMAFVNAIAWLAHKENHHPDLEVGYNHCLVQYSTHAVDGVTENDFICAGLVEGLMETIEATQCQLK